MEDPKLVEEVVTMTTCKGVSCQFSKVPATSSLPLHADKVNMVSGGKEDGKENSFNFQRKSQRERTIKKLHQNTEDHVNLFNAIMKLDSQR